jgi:hypothetical protein
MKPSVAACASFSDLRQRSELVSVRSHDAQMHSARICGHQLIPVLSRDLGSDEIQGWECIFCNEDLCLKECFSRCTCSLSSRS